MSAQPTGQMVNDTSANDEKEKLVISKYHNQYIYNRTFHEASIKLCDIMMHKYGWNYKDERYAALTPSGMSAIGTVFHSIFIDIKIHNKHCKPGTKIQVNIIYANELYGDTLPLIKYIHDIYSFKPFLTINLIPFQVTSNCINNKSQYEHIFNYNNNEMKTNDSDIQTTTNSTESKEEQQMSHNNHNNKNNENIGNTIENDKNGKPNCNKKNTAQSELLVEYNILYFESCSNPSGFIPNFEWINQIYCQKFENDKNNNCINSVEKNTYIIVDNTWLSSIVFNPFEWLKNIPNVIVVTSLSKYYSGGTAIMGCIITKNEKIFENINKYIDLNGNHVSPHNCQTILENINLMKQRMGKTSETTIKVAEYLEKLTQKTSKELKHKDENDVSNFGTIKMAILDVEYPLLKKHLSFEQAKKYFVKGFGPSVLSFKISIDSIDSAAEWMKSFKNIAYKTSFGGNDTRFDLSFDKKVDDGVWCRLAVGFHVFNSAESIVEQLGAKVTYGK